MNEDIRALKDALENLNTHRSTWMLSGIFSKNSENYELKPKFKLKTFQCARFSIDTINMWVFFKKSGIVKNLLGNARPM